MNLTNIADRLRAIASELDGSLPFDDIVAGSPWRLDGFGRITTEYGARPHQAVEAAISKLEEQGDAAALQVLSDVDRYFAFDLLLYPELAPETEDQRQAVRYARTRSRGPMFLGGMPSYPGPWRAETEEGAVFITDHTFVHLRGTTPGQYCEDYAQSLLTHAERLRAEAEDDLTPPVDYRR